MGWLTGQDKGSKARSGRRERRVRKCNGCNRPLNSKGQCPVCSRITVAHGQSAAPRPCPNGCGRTMRGGVCPGPNC